jgi:hypothetical protein
MRIMKSGPAIAVAAVLTFPSGTAAAETPATAAVAEEDAFLDILPKLEIPEHVEPIPGAVNEEFRNCEVFWPVGYKDAQSGPEARALRDIYGFIQAWNVVASKDCGCNGKAANWEDVELVAAALREQYGVEQLRWQQTKTIVTAADRLTAIAEVLCGGSF